ncbi:Obg-like ATPase [Saitoella coloradoensis]
MPPKKMQAAPKVLWGRPGNNLKTGIVGLPNVGKSTFFNAITKSELGQAANFPYATIDPEEARVAVSDARFDWLCQYYKPKSQVPASLTVFDIAGLTRGASTGVGLGNAFLSHVRAVDAIYQVVRAFDDAEITHVEGDVDPIRDLDIIHEELRIKDAEFVNKHLEVVKAFTKRGGQSLEMKAKKEEEATLEKLLKLLTEEKKDTRKGDWTNKEIEFINTLLLLTAKPVIYLVNLSEKDYLRQKNKHLARIKAWVDENAPGDLIIPFSVAFEDRLTRMTHEEVVAECKELNTKSMLPKIVDAGRAALNLINYFTCGPDEVRSWTIRANTKAPQAAGVIHTDFEKNFVVGEIFKYEDLKELGSEAEVKAKGKYMTKGKEYIVENGDICFWKAGRK